MNQKRMSAQVSLTPEARSALRDLTYALTGATRKHVTLSDAVIAACKMASADLTRTVDELPDDQQ
jgi:hypothetical protein